MASNKVSMFEKISFGSGDLGCTIIWNVVGMFLTIYYTDDVKISAAAVAAIMLSVRIFDGFSDLVMGYFLDRTNSKLGKARPWILWSAPFMAIFLVLCFAVPDFLGETMKVVYAFLTYFFLTVVIYTACNLSYCALTSFMTDDLQERAGMNSVRFVMTGLGSIVLGYVTPIAAKAFGSYVIICVIYGAAAFVLLLLCFFVCKERIKPQPRRPEDKVSAKESLRVLSKNTFFYYLVAFFIIDFANAGITGASGMYLSRYIIKDDAFFGTLNMAAVLPQVIACFMFPWIMNWFRGKWNTIIFGYVLYVIGYGMCYLLVGTTIESGSLSFYALLIGNGIKGIGWGIHLVAMFAMIADVAEYGEWKAGRRLEGATYSVSSFGFKIGLGMGGAVVGAVLSMVNYDASLEVQPQETLDAILTINFTIPLILSVIGLVLSITNNLDKIYPVMMKELIVRRAEEARKFSHEEVDRPHLDKLAENNAQ